MQNAKECVVSIGMEREKEKGKGKRENEEFFLLHPSLRFQGD